MDSDEYYSSSDSEVLEARIHADTSVERGSKTPVDTITMVSNALEDIEPPGDFFVHATFPVFPPPGLVVDGVGDIAIPILSSADPLVALCAREPRELWIVPADRVHINSVHWEPFVRSVMDRVLPPLGIGAETVVTPKLRQLVLVHAGAQPRGNAVAPVDRQVMGTLLIVLPSFFSGGDVVVHPPALSGDDGETRVWALARADPFCVHGGAFYRDSAFEVTPLDSGYLLYLQYDLIVDKASLMPVFCGNHERYARLVDALGQFFAPHACPGETFDHKLVYVLKSKPRRHALAMDDLGEDDRRVAESLARFCREAHGAFQLFLCKLKCTHESTNSRARIPDAEVVELCAPWKAVLDHDGRHLHDDMKLANPSGTPDYFQQLTADLGTEVVPTTRLAGHALEFDGEHHLHSHPVEDGPIWTWSKDFHSAALVVFPIQLFWQALYAGDPSAALLWWPTLVGANKDHARRAAAAFAKVPRGWPLEPACAPAVVEGLCRLGELEPLYNLLVGCLCVKFEPALRELTCTFEWNAIVATTKRVCGEWEQRRRSSRWCRYSRRDGRSARDRINLVTSLLHGELDPTKIASLLNPGIVQVDAFTRTPSRKELIAAVDDMAPPDSVATPTEYARMLALAWIVSPDTLRHYLQSPNVHLFVCAIAPVLMIFVEDTWGTSSPLPAGIRHILEEFRQDLASRLPSIRHISYLQKVYCDVRGKRQSQVACGSCEKLKRFMRSEEQAVTFQKPAFMHHVQETIDESYLRDLFLVVHDDTHETVTVQKAFDNPLYKRAQELVGRLDALLSRVRVPNSSERDTEAATASAVAVEDRPHPQTAVLATNATMATDDAGTTPTRGQPSTVTNDTVAATIATLMERNQSTTDERLSSTEENVDVCVDRVTAPTEPSVTLAHWTTLLGCDVKRVDGDGCCLYRAYLTAVATVARTRFTVSEITTLKRQVMEIAGENVRLEIDAGVLNSDVQTTTLNLDVSPTDTPEALDDAIVRHCATVGDRTVWGRPVQLCALAKLAQQPLYVIDVRPSTTCVHRYTTKTDEPVSVVAALSRADAERVFSAYLANRVAPVVLVLSHRAASGHFDALPVLEAHYEEWRRTGGSVVTTMDARRQQVHEELGLALD